MSITLRDKKTGTTQKIGRIARAGGGYTTGVTSTTTRTATGGSSTTRVAGAIEGKSITQAKETQAAIERVNQERAKRGEPALIGTNPQPLPPQPRSKETSTTLTTQAPPTGTITSPILNRPVTQTELSAAQQNAASQARIEAAKTAARAEDQLAQSQRTLTRAEYVAERQAQRDESLKNKSVFNALSRVEKENEENKVVTPNFRGLARGADTLSYYGTYRPVKYIEDKARAGNPVAKKGLFTAELGRAANNLVIDLTLSPESVVAEGTGEVAFRSAARGYEAIKFIGKKEAPAEQIIAPQFLKGEKFYPQAPPARTVKEIQETGLAYSTAPERFSKGAQTVRSLTNEERIAAGLPTSTEATGGIFAAPKANPAFTRQVLRAISNEESSSIRLIPELGNGATINRIETKAARLPKKYRNLEKGNLYLDTRAASERPGVAFSTPLSELGKTESEVIIPGRSILERGNKVSSTKYTRLQKFLGTDFDEYVKVPRVFGEPEAGYQKIAIRDYKNIGSNEILPKGTTRAGKIGRAERDTIENIYSRSAAREANAGILPSLLKSAYRSSTKPSSLLSYTPSNTTTKYPGSSYKVPYSPLKPPSSYTVPTYSSSNYRYRPTAITPPYYPVPRSEEPGKPSKKNPFPGGFPFLSSGGIIPRTTKSRSGSGGDKFNYAPTFTAAFFGIKATKAQRKKILATKTFTGTEVIRPLL